MWVMCAKPIGVKQTRFFIGKKMIESLFEKCVILAFGRGFLLSERVNSYSPLLNAVWFERSPDVCGEGAIDSFLEKADSHSEYAHVATHVFHSITRTGRGK